MSAPFAGQQFDDRAADALGRAGDDRLLAPQPRSITAPLWARAQRRSHRCQFFAAD